MVNYEIEDFFIVHSIRLLDAILSLIQLDKGSDPVIWIRPFTIREAHIESRMQRAAEESCQDDEDSDHMFVLRCKPKGKANRG